jgi:Transposase DNA-binding
VLSKDQIDSAWSKEEFWGIDFNDKRLTNRFIKLSEAFLNRPSVPINQACEDWSDTKAAYRLFDN